MSPSAAGDAGTPTLDAYAAQHGLFCRSASFGLPKATQLMRHGFMQEVPSLARGDLPAGLGDGWLAQANYAYEGRSDIERDPFTLVLVGAAASSSYAVRVLCHDRGLGERERSNPDADRQVVELDDRQVHLESDRFLTRYAVSTDHDQDQLKVWQIFSPGLIAWLTEEAPAGFSFELQDGALCCFVPGLTADPAELDALCAGAARVHSRIAEIEGSGAATSGDGTRADLVDRQLAEHTFASPPESVKAAARKFRHGLTLGDRAWALGAEAFFREAARAAGFEPMSTPAYRASHIDTALPGVLSHAAAGRTESGDPAFLVLTDSEDYDDMGWTNLVVDVSSPIAAFAVAGAAPRVDTSERGAMQVGTDGRSLILTTLDGGGQGREAKELRAFLSRADGLTRELSSPG
jgi:hypothetical protein